MRIALAVAVAVAAAACSDSDSSSDPDADPGPDRDATGDDCAGIVNSAFTTVDEHECGLSPDGPVFCKYWIQFDAAKYVWQHSDVESVGDYTCVDGAIEGNGGFDVTGTYDPQTDLLVWDGLTYERSL